VRIFPIIGCSRIAAMLFSSPICLSNPSPWSASALQRLLPVAADRRTHGLGHLAVVRAADWQRRQRPLFNVLLPWQPSELGWHRQDSASDCCSLRRTGDADPKLPVRLLRSCPLSGPASFRFCVREAAAHDHQDPATFCH
jgi:hypothetical protein